MIFHAPVLAEYCDNTSITKIIEELNGIFIKISMTSFTELEKKTIKNCMETKDHK